MAPLLAFDGDGWRLGYGGGFYDRTVASLRGFGQRVKLIGIAYEEQKLDKIPVGPFDMPLDAVLSPAGINEFEVVATFDFAMCRAASLSAKLQAIMRLHSR